MTEKPYCPEYFTELVEKYKVNAAFLAPRHASALVACPQATPERLASMNVLGIGGGWIPSETLKRVKNVLRNGIVGFGYATSEIGGISSAPFREEFGNTVGALVAGMRARIVDENGANLGPGEMGELTLTMDVVGAATTATRWNRNVFVIRRAGSTPATWATSMRRAICILWIARRIFTSAWACSIAPTTSR